MRPFKGRGYFSRPCGNRREVRSPARVIQLHCGHVVSHVVSKSAAAQPGNHAMQTAMLYIVTAGIFLSLDMLGIKYLIRPVFERHIGSLLADPLRLGPAALFYLAYVGGILWFASLPAMKEGAPLQALVAGAILGFLCYGTYEMTNYATLARWSLEQVVVDGLWGIALTGFSAWAGVAIMTGRLS